MEKASALHVSSSTSGMSSKKSSLKQQDGKKSSLKRSLSVSFPKDEVDMAQVLAEIEPCMNYSDDDRKRLWYARSDYHLSRSTARVIAKESERYGHSKQLDGVYISAFQQEAQDALNLWALHGHSRRGLERWANTHHGLIRRDDQHAYLQGLLRAQNDKKLKNDCNDDKHAQMERLREVGLVLSRKSRLFAQMIGEADAHAAKWESVNMHQPHTHASPGLILQATLSQEYAGLPPGTAKLRMMMSPPRSLGLGGPPPSQRKINRVTDLPSRTMPNPPRIPGATSGSAIASRNDVAAAGPKITIKPRTTGRVPRIA